MNNLLNQIKIKNYSLYNQQIRRLHNKNKIESQRNILNFLVIKINKEKFLTTFFKLNKSLLVISTITITGIYFLRNNFNNNNEFVWINNNDYLNKLIQTSNTNNNHNEDIYRYYLSTILPSSYILILLYSINNSRVKKVNDNSLLNRFGKVGVAIYFGYWILTGIIIYFLVVNKYINREKLEEQIKKYQYLASVYEKISSKIGDKYTDFAIAYTLNSAFELFRLPTFLLFMKFLAKKKSRK
jgi:hypothetical protein